LCDPHNVGLLDGMTAQELEAQCGPKSEPVNLANYQQVRYVSANTGSDTTGSGTSGNPWQSIQYSLSQIADASETKRYAILVAEGTYTGTSNPAVTMEPWVDMWGGFEGVGWTRDIVAHVSKCDGENARRCVYGASNARIDGFTITRSSTGVFCPTGLSPTISNNVIVANSGPEGVGIWCYEDASPEIMNNLISRNSATDGGGGILCQTGSLATISNNVITENTANYGGGIYCYAGAAPVISGNVIHENTSTDFGGAIYSGGPSTILNNVISGNSGRAGAGIFSDAFMTLLNNLILGNVATGDGGGMVSTYGSSAISNNIFLGNSAGGEGGGIYCVLGFPNISNNLIAGNQAANGGGIACYQSASPTISSNAICGNSATEDGGGIYVYCYDNGSPTISRNAISGNTAEMGGGVWIWSTSPRVSDNTILGNSVTLDGGGICCWSSASPTICGNLVFENSTDRWGGGVFVADSFSMLDSIVRGNLGPSAQVYDGGGAGTSIASYCNIESGWAGSGSNNVDLDPQFTGVIASGTVSALAFDSALSQTVLSVNGMGLSGRDLTGWIVQVGDTLPAPTKCAYAPILAYTTNTLVVAGDATKRGAVTFTPPANWQIRDYHLQPDSPMEGLGVGPDDATYGAMVSRFDGDGQPRFGAKCEIGPDEVEWDTDFPESVWGVFEIESGATADFQYVSFENGSGVNLDGSAAGGEIENCRFFQHYGAGLDASGGVLSSVASTTATACWGPGIVAPDATLRDVLAERNRDTGLIAASATDSRSDSNRGHGFDLTDAAENLIADSNTSEGIRASTVLNSMARSNGAWGIVGDATDCDAQNNGSGGILGSATGSRVIGNGGPGIQGGAQVTRCEVRDNTSTGVLNVALIEDCTISGNDGAGIGGATQVTNSSVSDNAGPGAVGGTLFDTTLESNQGGGALSPERLSHCTVSRNAGDGIAGTDGTATVNNSLVSSNEGAGLVNLASINLSNIVANAGFAAVDTLASGGGARDFTGNYWGATATDELTTKPENANLTFVNDTLDGSGAWALDVWPFASSTIPEAPRAGGPPWAWCVRPDLSSVTSIGPTTFTITYTASMNTVIDPSVTFGPEDPYQLRIVESDPGWVSPTTWQGTYTVGTNTGDGIHTIRMSGAMAADGFPIPDDTSHRFYINTRDPHVANNGLATAIGTNSMNCTWDPPPGGPTPTDRYVLQMSQVDLDHFERSNPALIADTQYTVNSLTSETLYFFKVQRVETDGTAEDWTPIFFQWTGAVVPPSPITMTFYAHALDASTGLPVAGALATLTAETQAQAATGPGGWATLSVSALPKTAYGLTVTHADYGSAARLYTTGATLSDEILLVRKAPVPVVATIYGFVTDAGTGQAVADALVIADGASVGNTQSAGDGSYSLDISALPDGFIVVHAQAQGGGLSASAFVPAMAGSQRVDLALVPLPGSPTNPGATAITLTSIYWTWQDNASNEIGYEVFAGPGATAPVTSVTLTSADVQAWAHTGLSTNTQYAFQARARLATGVSAKTPNISRFTLACMPAAPVLTTPQVNSLDVAIGSVDS
ncbi:right-handed parallel beta-helix repeat-containing protein, partial [bacterium]|nr:right-handed parallel beta-helix repeat-containing protein [bacterium]